MLRRLNTYVHLTLAKHSIYATALCLRIDTARGVVEWASGGHPPAFLRAADGTVKDLEPTTFVLGACPDGPFGTAQHEMPFSPGDAIIAYTDGAIEARRPGDAQMLRVDGMRAFVADAGRSYDQPIATGSWAQRVLEMVTRFRGGMPAEDDTLVVEIFRPLPLGGAVARSVTQAAGASMAAETAGASARADRG
jgi:serine phosphatase RsbU (regulator of sigma subunit)